MLIQDLIDRAGMSRFQVAVVGICLVINLVDGFDVLVMGFAASGVAVEWSLTESQVGLLLSSGLVGMALGSALVAPLADRIGRRPLTLVCLAACAAGMALAAVGTGPAVLALCRLLTGLGIGGMVAGLPVINSEYTPRRLRGTMIALYATGLLLGGAVAALLISQYGWRATFAVGAALTLAMLLVTALALPESLDYLAHRRPAGALARINGLLGRMRLAPVEALPPLPPRERSGVRAAVLRGQGAVRLALLWTAYFIMMAGFYLAASWTPRLLEQSGYSAGQGVSGGVLLNLGGIAGTLLFGALALRAPGRVLTMLAFLAAGAAFLTMGLVLGTTAAALAAAVAVGISVNAAGAGLNAGAPGLYPAGVRATGAGWAMAFGRLGALTAPRPGGAAPGPLPGPGDAVQHVRAAAGRGRARGRRHHLVRRAGLCARAHDQGEPMKAVRLHDYHKHPVVDEVPEPEPSGPLDVIVRIGGAGVCRTDLHIIEGQWAEAMAPRLPYTIGHENAGWVHAVGEGVTNVRVGDTVILHPQPSCGLCPACRAGRDMQCADAFFPGVSGHDGGMAEYLRTTARACVRLDPDTDPADVAALADAGITAYHAVRKALPLLHPGTSAVVLGAGGLGHIGVQALAALTAARIIVVDRNPGALHLAASIGADATVPADGDHVEAVRALTGGRGADVVFDFVAEQGAEQDAWEMTAPAGSLFVVGYGGELWIPTMALVAEEKNVIGNMVGTYTDLAELMVLAQAGKVTLHTVRYPLEEAPRALDDLALGRIRGRAILVP